MTKKNKNNFKFVDIGNGRVKVVIKRGKRTFEAVVKTLNEKEEEELLEKLSDSSDEIKGKKEKRSTKPSYANA